MDRAGHTTHTFKYRGYGQSIHSTESHRLKISNLFVASAE